MSITCFLVPHGVAVLVIVLGTLWHRSNIAQFWQQRIMTFVLGTLWQAICSRHSYCLNNLITYAFSSYPLLGTLACYAAYFMLLIAAPAFPTCCG